LRSSLRTANTEMYALTAPLVKAIFHYAVQLASRSQTSSQPKSITLSSLWRAREQVCDQLASC